MRKQLQNSLSAYLSSGIRNHLPLQQALEICVAEDSATFGANGRQEAYAAIAAGIEGASFIPEDIVRAILHSEFEFIGISALAALTEKLDDAELGTLKLFYKKVLNNREIQLTEKFKYALINQRDLEPHPRIKQKLTILLSEVEQFLKELIEIEHNSY